MSDKMKRNTDETCGDQVSDLTPQEANSNVLESDLAALKAAGHRPVARIQTAIPPDVPQSQHFAPLFQFASSATESELIDAYIRGFHHYWHTAQVHPLVCPA